ncbi:MAG: hypothetical protein PVI57_10020 [Gemmatimonadota bacterium]|jgi:hypothetical protein
MVGYTLHRDLNLLATRFSGAVTDDEFIELYRTIFDDPDYVLGTNELADLREVEDLQLSTEALRKVEYLTRMKYGREGLSFRTALIAPSDSAFGVGRIYEVFASAGPEAVSVFRTATEAFAHLGVEPMAPEVLHGGDPA